MKKLLILTLTVLLIGLAVMVVKDGQTMGDFVILGVQQIFDVNEEIDNNIAKVESLIAVNIAQEESSLQSAVTTLLTNKEEYYNLAKISTEGELQQANTEETYLIEYIWTRMGRHATNERITLKLDVLSSQTGADFKNLSFIIKGEYVDIIDYVSKLEEDEELNFKIDSFKIEANTEGNISEYVNEAVVATFVVEDVKIQQESTSHQIETTTE